MPEARTDAEIPTFAPSDGVSGNGSVEKVFVGCTTSCPFLGGSRQGFLFVFAFFFLAGLTGGQVEPEMFHGILCTICTAPASAPGILRGGGRESVLTVAPQEEEATRTGLQVDEELGSLCRGT